MIFSDSPHVFRLVGVHESQSTTIVWQSVLPFWLFSWFCGVLTTFHGKHHIAVVDFCNIFDPIHLFWLLGHSSFFSFVVQLLEDHLVQVQTICRSIHHGLVAPWCFGYLILILLIGSRHPPLRLSRYSRHIDHIWLLCVCNRWMLLMESLRLCRCSHVEVSYLRIRVGHCLYFAYIVWLESQSKLSLHPLSLRPRLLMVNSSEGWKVTRLGSIHVRIWHFIVNIYLQIF